MRQIWKSLSSLSLVFTLSFSVFAQDVKDVKQVKPVVDKTGIPEKTESASTEKVLTIQQQHALGLLDQLYDTSKEFTDDAVRVQVQARIADALWEHDETRARQQFEDSFHSIDSITATQPQDKNQLPIVFASKQYQLRSQIIGMLTRRDPSLAEQLTKSVVDVPISSNSNFVLPGMGGQSEQSELYLQMAMNLVETDPSRAAQMAKESLKSGLSPTLIILLQSIRRKSASLADDVFTEALEAAKRDPSRASASISSLMSYVFPNAPTGGFTISFGGSSAGSSPTADTPNPVLISQFLNFAYDTVTRQINSSATATDTDGQPADIRAAIDYGSIQRLLPYFDQYMPDKSATIRAKLDEVTRSISAKNRDQLTTGMQNSSVSDLLSKAEAAKTPAEKDSLYMRAAIQAMRDDPEQALSILDKVTNDQMKGPIASIIRMQAALKAVTRDDIEAAVRYTKDIPNLQQRVMVYTMIAGRLTEKKDTIRAKEILSEAETLIMKGEEGTDKANAMLQIAAYLARIDPLRAFETMRLAVDAVNHVPFVDPAQQQQQQIGSGSNNTSVRTVSFGINSFNFEGSLSVLARTDFQRALLLAQAVEKKESSTLAQLAVCRGVLIKPAEPQAATTDKSEKETKTKKEETPKPKAADKPATEKKPVEVEKPGN